MTKFKNFILVLATSLTILLPHWAIAQTNANTVASGNTCADLKQQFQNAGGSNVITNVPQYCSVESVYAKFINIALFAAGIVGIIAVIYGGYLYMTARDNEAQKKSGKSVLTWAIIGLIVVVLAAVLVNVAVSALVDNQVV